MAALADSQFVELVQTADAILKIQETIKTKMSDGFFGMAIARKGGCIVTPYNCREDFSAGVTVTASEATGAYEIWEEKPDMDPLLLISGLPPPSLKKSQKHFSAVVREVIDLANLVSKIQRMGESRAEAGTGTGAEAGAGTGAEAGAGTGAEAGTETGAGLEAAVGGLSVSEEEKSS
jgi:hypothetical protein